MADLTIMVGLPRSGKSTWIEEHKTHEIVVSNDWIRENILHSEYSKSNHPAIWMITDATLRILLCQNKDVILDGVHLRRFERKFFIDLAKECNAFVRMVYMKTPLRICYERNNSPEGHKLSATKLAKMHNSLEVPISEEFNSLKTVHYDDDATTVRQGKCYKKKIL